MQVSFPLSTLNNMQKSILTFDEVQKNEQGSLRYVDIFYFQQVQLYQVDQIVLNKVRVDGYQNHQIL